MGLPSPLGSTLSFYHIGRLKTEDSHVFTFGGYNCWHIVTEGRGFVKTNGKEYNLDCGDMFSVMYENEIEYGPYPGEEWAFYYIRIDGEGSDSLSRKIGLTPEKPCMRIANKDAVMRLFESAWQSAKDNYKTPEYYASVVYKICSLLCAEHKPTVRTQEALVDEALRMIEDPLSRNFNVNELSAALHVSRVTLFNAFKQITGKSPQEHLVANQIKHLKNLILENPAVSIAQLAKATAYSSDKHLISTFKRITGMTPGEFRNSSKW